MPDGDHSERLASLRTAVDAIPLNVSLELHETSVSDALQPLVDEFAEEFALLDEGFNILAINNAWRNALERHGLLGAWPGDNYRDFCLARAAEGYEPAAQAAEAFEEMAFGKRDCWRLSYNGAALWAHRDYEICIHRISVHGEKLISVTRTDLTEIVQLRRDKDESQHLLEKGQASERQRMGRELHDSTSQVLVAIGLLLGRLRHDSSRKGASALIGEIEELLAEVHREIRTISYLAHPPALERTTLAVALASLVQGFANRAKLQAEFRIESESQAVPSHVDGALYRIAQEALSNIYRHAFATEVSVQLYVRCSIIHLVISDNGVGISAEKVMADGGAGVGIAGMRARMSELGGRLTVRRRAAGTAIVASVRLS